MATSSLTQAHQQQYGHITLNLPADRKAFPHVVFPRFDDFQDTTPMKIPTHARHPCHAALTHRANAHSYRAFQTLYEDRTHNPSGFSREIKAYIAKDSYRSRVLQFSASLALNLIISRHLLLQMKLSISSSVEGKKITKKSLTGK